MKQDKPTWQTDQLDASGEKKHYEWDWQPGDEFLLAAASSLMSGSSSEPAKGGLTEFLRKSEKASKRG